MGDQLTNEDKKFVKELLETGNKTQSAIKAYGYKNENTAGVMALTKLRKTKIQNAIKSIADRVPDDKLHEVLMEGLDAENNEKPDYGVRHKYLDTALKLKGAYETDENKNINILMPVLVKFLDKNETDSDGDTN